MLLVFEDGFWGSGVRMYRAAFGVNLPLDSRLVSSSAAMSNRAEYSRRQYRTVEFRYRLSIFLAVHRLIIYLTGVPRS